MSGEFWEGLLEVVALFGAWAMVLIILFTNGGDEDAEG